MAARSLSQTTRRLAAIMFTDMVGYTAVAQKDESLSLSLVEEQGSMIRAILGRHKGREVKTVGDAFLVEFSSALAAVRCAYDIQRAARERNAALPEKRRIHLRIGIHLGDVVDSQGDISDPSRRWETFSSAPICLASLDDALIRSTDVLATTRIPCTPDSWEISSSVRPPAK